MQSIKQALDRSLLLFTVFSPSLSSSGSDSPIFLIMISSSLSLLVVAVPVVLGATIDVQVGANGLLAYDPEFVSANAGDIINFIL